MSVIESITESLDLIRAHNDRLVRIITALTQTIDAHDAERARIAAVLATFHAAPVSLSSVQPVLALAEELNLALRTKS